MRGFSLVELMVVVAIIGLLAALGGTRHEKLTCKANRTEAYSAMSAAAAFEESLRAERSRYMTLAPSCPASSTTCVVYASSGSGSGSGGGRASRFHITAEVTPSGYVITAMGKSSTSMSGAIWRMDQSRTITDVTRTCR